MISYDTIWYDFQTYIRPSGITDDGLRLSIKAVSSIRGPGLINMTFCMSHVLPSMWQITVKSDDVFSAFRSLITSLLPDVSVV